jgi:hypothetical protein
MGLVLLWLILLSLDAVDTLLISIFVHARI